MGRIFIRLANVPKAIELSVGTTEKDILDICQKHKAKQHPPTGKVSSQTSHQRVPKGPAATSSVRGSDSHTADRSTAKSASSDSTSTAIASRNQQALAEQAKPNVTQTTNEVHKPERPLTRVLGPA